MPARSTDRPRRGVPRLPAAALLALLSGCIAPSVVDSKGRSVEDDLAAPAGATPWRAATAADLAGLFESERIDGGEAASLLRVLYWFADDGRYSGAALVAGAPPAFQTLAGRYALADGVLELDGEQKLAATVRGESLQLKEVGGDGTIVLRRQELR